MAKIKTLVSLDDVNYQFVKEESHKANGASELINDIIKDYRQHRTWAKRLDDVINRLAIISNSAVKAE